MQNQIKDITPAGVHYDTYEEAAAALYEAERERANMPFNKENNIGSYMVNGRTQLERIMEARQLQKHMDIENDKVSYYVIAEEWSAIGDAMRMRGVRFGGGKVGAILEYRIVPMMICSVKIGEELSQAALTRGLGGPVKRTNICKLGFHVQDVIFLLICLGAFAAQIYVLAARG